MMKLFLTSIICMASCVSLYAAEISLRALPSPSQGLYAYQLTLDPQGVSLNAIAGTISFPNELFELDSLDTSSSLVSLWVTQPAPSKEKSVNLRTQIVFEGIMPGGFTGVLSPQYEGEQPGKVFTILLRPKGKGGAILTIDSAVLLANDGQGTSVSTTKKDVMTSLSQEIKRIPRGNPVKISSGNLQAFITRQESVAKGSWYVVTTLENNSKTIATLSVAESIASHPDALKSYEWKVFEGPYVLLHQSRNRFTHVRADYYDNTYEVVTLAPVENSTRNIVESCILLSIIVVLLGSIIRSYYVTRHTKHTQKK